MAPKVFVILCAPIGSVAERLNAPVLKTGVEKSIVSSNLTGPAIVSSCCKGLLGESHEKQRISRCATLPLLMVKKHLVGTGLAQRANLFAYNKARKTCLVGSYPSEPSMRCKAVVLPTEVLPCSVAPSDLPGEKQRTKSGRPGNEVVRLNSIDRLKRDHCPA